MDDALPSISSGTVGSRFVSQEELDTAKARRDEQWKAAYARCALPEITFNIYNPQRTQINHS